MDVQLFVNAVGQPVMVTATRMCRLVGVSQKGKNRVRENGDWWVVLKEDADVGCVFLRPLSRCSSTASDDRGDRWLNLHPLTGFETFKVAEWQELS